MGRDILDSKRNAVNRTAARVVGKGVHWTPDKKILTVESDNPLPLRNLEDLEPQARAHAQAMIGLRCGRLTVIGLSTTKKRYVCRCYCGRYCLRSGVAIKNPANQTIDRCELCRALAAIKKHHHYVTYGVDQPWHYFD
ncbi:TPA: hypothetical protein NPP60_005058 [Klebsiella variicola subsp. variicola]|nr:hypothetical protein [Klebsiella variicola subsp. variicola]